MVVVVSVNCRIGIILEVKKLGLNSGCAWFTSLQGTDRLCYGSFGTAGCEECGISVIGSKETRLFVSAALCWEVSHTLCHSYCSNVQQLVEVYILVYISYIVCNIPYWCEFLSLKYMKRISNHSMILKIVVLLSKIWMPKIYERSTIVPWYWRCFFFFFKIITHSTSMYWTLYDS